MSNSVHQELTFNTSSQNLYSAYMEADKHAAFTGAPCTIEDTEGKAFTAYGGGVEGRNIELTTNQRIIQAWRGADWQEGVYSIVRIELKDKGDQCVLTLDHTGCPDGTEAHLEEGWHKMYWKPLETWLEKN